MRISCEICHAEYDVDESRVPPSGFPVKCPKCLSVFVIHRSEEAAASRDLPAPAETSLPDVKRGGTWERAGAQGPPAPPSRDEAPPVFDPEIERILGGDEPLAPAPAVYPPAPRVAPPPPPARPAPAAPPPAAPAPPVPPAPAMPGSPDVDATQVTPQPWPAAGGASPWEPPSWEAAQPRSWTTEQPGEGLDFSDLFGGSPEPPAAPRVEAVEYVVRTADGSVVGPLDQVTVRAQLQTGQLQGSEECSSDGGLTWRPIGTFSEFADLLRGDAVPGGVSTELARVEVSPARPRTVEVLDARSYHLEGRVGVGIERAGGGSLETPPSGSIDGEGPTGLGAPRGYGVPETATERRPGEFTAAAPTVTRPAPAPATAPATPLARSVERPSWLAPPVTAEGARSLADARRSRRRRRILAYVSVGLVACGGMAFLLLWDPPFEGEGKIRKRISLDEAQLRRYRAQARQLLRDGATYRAYADARRRLASVVRSDPADVRAKALYLQAMLYLIRDYGQVAIGPEATKVKRELDRAGGRDLETLKAKASYALWKRDVTSAVNYVNTVLRARPEDGEAQFLHGLALSTTKTATAAVALFDQLLARDPANLKVLRAKAEALLLGDRDAGVATLRKLVELSPSNAGALLRLAEIYFEDGRREDSKKLFLWIVDPRAVARREASPDEIARAYSYLGRIVLEDRDYKVARQYLESALQAATSESERAHALTALGDVLIAQRDFKAAIARLEAARQKQPDNPDVLGRLAVAYVGGGQGEKARGAIADALKILRARKVEELTARARAQHYLQAARVRLSSAQVNEGDDIPRVAEAVTDYRAAVELAEKAGGRDGNRVILEARLRLASLLRRKKNLAGALAELEAAAKIDAGSAAVQTAFGEVYADQGQAAMAEAAYRKALAADPKFLPAAFNLAELLAERGKVDEALGHLDAIAKVDPSYPNLHLAMAIGYLRQKKYTEAIQAFERAVKANPEDPRVYVRIGIAHFELGGEENLAKARTYLDKAIEKNRQLNEAYYYRGRVVLALKKPESAVDDFKTACDREPDNGVYRIYWGWAFEQMGSYRDAMFQYNRAIELLRDQKNEVDIALALYRRGRLRLQRDEVRAALADLEEALKYDAANTEVLVLLGDSLAQARQHAKAVERYRAALARGKKLPGLWYKLGRSLLEVNRRSEATRAFLNAASEDPSDCYPHYYLGYLYKDGKQERRAVQSLKRFLSLCKDAPERKDVRRDIYDMERRLGLRRAE